MFTLPLYLAFLVNGLTAHRPHCTVFQTREQTVNNSEWARPMWWSVVSLMNTRPQTQRPIDQSVCLLPSWARLCVSLCLLRQSQPYGWPGSAAALGLSDIYRARVQSWFPLQTLRENLGWIMTVDAPDKHVQQVLKHPHALIHLSAVNIESTA